jgi:hypothetical protein
MSLPWATFLHCGASFHDASYTLLQSNFIALTVVCVILSVSSHCNILSTSLRTCCCGSIIVAFPRTTGSLPLHYWHHLPWCFLDELVCCGQLRLVDSGTMEWSHSQTLWFICFQHSCHSLLEHLAFIFGCRHYGQSSHLSMWLDGKDIKLVTANGHCFTPLRRLHCSDMHKGILETPLWASLCS